MSEDEFGFAIAARDARRVMAMLASGVVDANTRLPSSYTPDDDETKKWPALLVAARDGDPILVTLLLDAGAHIDAVNAIGDTACHVAAQQRAANVVQVLIERGCNVAITNNDGHTPLSYAVESGNKDITVALINAGGPFDNASDLCRAAALSISVISTLLERQVNVGLLRSDGGQTPLHFATDAAEIDMLVKVAGVDINVRDFYGLSCTLYLIIYVRPPPAEAVRKHIEFGVDIDQCDDVGRSPLDEACLRDRGGELTVLLLAAGANVHTKRRVRDGGSASAPSRALALLIAGADFDAPDSDGTTARQMAESYGGREPTTDEVEAARRRIARTRLDLVRPRAFQVCVGLQSRGLDALQMCEILLHACGRVAPLVPFHQWWKIVTTAKHFVMK